MPVKAIHIQKNERATVIHFLYLSIPILVFFAVLSLMLAGKQ